MKILAQLQQWLHDLHDIEIDLHVGEFVIGDDIKPHLPGAQPGLPEQLFVSDGDEEVGLSLYIAPQIIETLEQHNPSYALHAKNLESYCVALEGVSHFVFLVWRTGLERPVRALELEIQAEVDKFVSSWLLLQKQGHALRDTAESLSSRLFERYKLRNDVPADEHERYRKANSVAHKYTRRLIEQFGKDTDGRRILRDARQFYRTGLADKLAA